MTWKTLAKALGALAALLLAGALLNWAAALKGRVEHEAFLQAEKPGALRQLGRELKAKGLIPSELVFRAAARLTRSDRRLQAGYYAFDNRMGVLGILGKLRRGELVRVAVVIREGADLYELAAEAARVKAVDTPALLLEKARQRPLLEKLEKRFALERRIPSAEGFLYPDTYLVKKGDGFNELVELALARFEARIAAPYRVRREEARLKKARLEPLWFYLCAASLIERETPTESERPLVASVLENRLRIGGKLRFDPTILYALKLNGGYERILVNGVPNIRNEHFSLRSPYNTYWVHGLPAGPICNPSASSFEAALSPAKTEWLFFVAKGFGVKEHAFSKTYEEHQRLTQKYLLRR